MARNLYQKVQVVVNLNRKPQTNKFKSNLSSSSVLNCRRREFDDYRNKIVAFGNDFCALFIFQLMQIMIKVSDVSNEARPMEVAEPWLDCLLQEFFIQVKSFCNNIF